MWIFEYKKDGESGDEKSKMSSESGGDFSNIGWIHIGDIIQRSFHQFLPISPQYHHFFAVGR